MNGNLKPCPFCGCEMQWSKASVDGGGGVLVHAGTKPCVLRLLRIYFNSYEDAAEDWNRRASPWIPVEERLPEEEDVYLLWRTFGGGEFPDCAAYFPDKEVWIPNHRGRITHWQLPEPPGREKK